MSLRVAARKGVAADGLIARLRLALAPAAERRYAEQHGTGPLHYSSQMGATVLELYPASAAPSSVRLGISVPDVAAAVESVRAIGGGRWSCEFHGHRRS